MRKRQILDKKSPRSLQELRELGDKAHLLDLLGRLSEIGVVKRGFHASCPSCITPAWYPLATIHKNLTCPGCSHVFPLPVQYPPGSGLELGWEYTLNSLVNRAMDQDVLPSVLALYHETKPECLSFFVPGLELCRTGNANPEIEFDYLFIREQALFCGECKAGTELSDKDFRTARSAADLGAKEFSFCTVRRFSEATMKRVKELRAELKEQSRQISIKVLTGEQLLGDALP
jgi:hypothetical protein